MQDLKIGDLVKVRGNAPGTVWESGVIEHIQDGKAYLLYGVRKLGEWHGVRGMCTGERLEDLEMIPNA